MANYRPRNHKHRGGDLLCIGGELRIKDSGKLIVESGAEIEGLGNPTDEQIDAVVNAYLNKNPVQPTPIDASLSTPGAAADAAVVGVKKADNSQFIAEGKAVVGYSVEGHDLELAARMVAYQSGTGLPSPENVRPIAGFDVLTFNRTEDGAEVTVDLGETVYGGTVDLTTGVLTIDRGYLVVDGNSNVTRQAANDGGDTILVALNTNMTTNYDKRLEDSCDKLPHTVTIHTSNWAGATAQNTKYSESFSFGSSANNTTAWLYIRLNKSRFAGSYEVSDVKAWLADNPLTITYALTEPRTVQLSPQKMAALMGKNTLSSNATSMTVRGVDYPIGKTQTMQDYEPKKQIVGLPELALSGDNSEESKENKVTLSYAWSSRLGTLTSKWQGSSSITFGKEVDGKMNHTIEFDEAFEAVEGWGAQKKYVLKADVVDALHLLNVLGAKIYGQVAATRTDDPDDLASMPNYGAIDGFPVIVTLNGEFHGLYTWTIPKDPWMMNMGIGENEAILCADMHVAATQFKAEAICDGTDFKVEHNSKDDASWIKESLNAMINACINSDGSDIDTTLATRLNITSMMDHMIITALFDAHDNTDKNYLIATKNGVRWFIVEYDLDSILGMWFDGSYFRPATDWLRNFYWWSNHNRAAYLIYTYKRAELKARYLELRASVLSEDNIITTATNYVNQIPENVYRADRERWPLLPNTSANNVARLADWYRRRVAFIDKEVNGWIV